MMADRFSLRLKISVEELSFLKKLSYLADCQVMVCRRMGAGVTICLLGVICGLSCGRRSASPPPDPPVVSRPEVGAVPEARVLLSLPRSAYHASIAADDDDVAYLLTSTAAYRLAPDHPPAEMPMDLGFGATTTRSSFVYWSRGAVFEAPKAGGAAGRLVSLAERPQLLVASEAGIGWLGHGHDGSFSLNAIRSKKPTTLYTSHGSIDAVTMLGEQIFFVERPAGKDWRIGRIRLTVGGTPEFTAPRSGRAPAMLAGRHDLVFYDGSRFEVRRLSLDLRHERTPASGFICSPVAVSEHIYCAQPDGIFELRADERPHRLVSGDAQRLVTDLAATPKRLLWIVDVGADELEVRSLALR